MPDTGLANFYSHVYALATPVKLPQYKVDADTKAAELPDGHEQPPVLVFTLLQPLPQMPDENKYPPLPLL